MNQLIVALDVDTGARAGALADALRGVAGGFKIGSRLFTAEGPSAVRQLVERGHRVFLDLKFHDIPNTVAGAVAAATRLGVWMVNVHASGGIDMMRAARTAAADMAARQGARPPLLIAVTVLTSLDATMLAEVGVCRGLLDQVESLACQAQDAGLDGVVASPQELPRLRVRCGPQFLIVTPGIRGTITTAGGGGVEPLRHDDQARTLSAGEAIRAGASYLVVGRPIIEAADPRAAAEAIVTDMDGSGDGR
jgi:orotidine-5'-phosphate decarboxylase